MILIGGHPAQAEVVAVVQRVREILAPALDPSNPHRDLAFLLELPNTPHLVGWSKVHDGVIEAGDLIVSCDPTGLHLVAWATVAVGRPVDDANHYRQDVWRLP